MNKTIFLAILSVLWLSACGDKNADDAAKAKEHFMSEQQKVLEQAKEVQDAATEALEKEKKKLEEMKDK